MGSLLLKAQVDFLGVCQERDLLAERVKNMEAKQEVGPPLDVTKEALNAERAELEKLLLQAQSALQDVIHDRDRLAEQLESVEALPSGVLDERLTRLEACSGHSTTGSASSFLLAAGLA